MAVKRPQQVAVAERRAQAVRMRAAGTPWQAIADTLGYSSPAAACVDVKRALEVALKEQNLAAAELRELELQHLDMLRKQAMTVLLEKHVTIQHGRVVSLNGSPVPDDGPVLAAIDRLLKISTRRAALLGLDAPAQVVTDATVRYEIHGLDAPDDIPRPTHTPITQDDTQDDAGQGEG
jgi:hypothetical protein